MAAGVKPLRPGREEGSLRGLSGPVGRACLGSATLIGTADQLAPVSQILDGWVVWATI
jgi:hypothetical protein